MKIDSVSVIIPTYREAARAAALAKAMRGQNISSGISLDIIIVDDGSDDGSAEYLNCKARGWARIVVLERNSGRSAARNSGARSTSSDMLVFVDSDCLPEGSEFLASHIAALRSGAIASTGHVTGCGNIFWDRYQATASARRRVQHATGAFYAGSSQNLAVSRAAFEQVGGFDTGYLHYGFEDRDLLLRIARHGPVVWTAGATVSHLDDISMLQVSRKMVEAAACSSKRFAARHPAAYVALGYGRIDARARPWLRGPAHLAHIVVAPLSRLVDRLLPSNMLPYPVKAGLVRTLTGLSYLAGTIRTRAP